MSMINAVNYLVSTFGLEASDAVALIAEKRNGQWIDTVRNLNHATKIWLDLGQGAYKTDELQTFLEFFGAKSKSAASNRACMQRSAQAGVNKYKVAPEDTCEFPVANTRTGRVRSRAASADESAALDALLGL